MYHSTLDGLETPRKKVSSGKKPIYGGEVGHVTNAGIFKTSAKAVVNSDLAKLCQDNLVIAVLDGSEKTCPFCSQILISVDKSKRRCMSCHNYFIFSAETLTMMAQQRMSAGVYTSTLLSKPAAGGWIYNPDEQTQPLVYYYRATGMFVHVNRAMYMHHTAQQVSEDLPNVPVSF